MSCDMFSSMKAHELLKGKFIYFFGSSNMRGLYKDLVWLLEKGTLIPNDKLKRKNEESYEGDVRVSNGRLHSGRNYEEVREYNKDPYVKFQFITRLFLRAFIDSIQNLKSIPDVVVINSSVWDLSRWGIDGVNQYKKNIHKTFEFLKKELPNTRIIWTTTFPISFKSHGALFNKNIEVIRNMLPWHILYANTYASKVAESFKIDILDFHYNFRFLLNYHTPDGVHWQPKAVRLATNLLLTHIALCWNHRLPGLFQLDQSVIERSQRFCNTNKKNIRKDQNFAENRVASTIKSEKFKHRKVLDSNVRQLHPLPADFAKNNQVPKIDYVNVDHRNVHRPMPLSAHQNFVESKQMSEIDYMNINYRNVHHPMPPSVDRYFAENNQMSEVNYVNIHYSDVHRSMPFPADRNFAENCQMSEIDYMNVNHRTVHRPVPRSVDRDFADYINVNYRNVHRPVPLSTECQFAENNQVPKIDYMNVHHPMTFPEKQNFAENNRASKINCRKFNRRKLPYSNQRYLPLSLSVKQNFTETIQTSKIKPKKYNYRKVSYSNDRY